MKGGNTMSSVTKFENPLAVMEIIHGTLSLAKNLIVSDKQSYDEITSLYSKAREWKKIIDTKRKEMTEPLRKETAKINDKAKQLTDSLDQVIEIANVKTNSYIKVLEQQKQKEDEKLKEIASMFDAEGELYIPVMEKSVRGEGAMTVSKTVNKFIVEDISKVPLKYLMVDMDKVEEAVKMGVLEIPGITITQETTTKLRIR